MMQEPLTSQFQVLEQLLVRRTLPARAAQSLEALRAAHARWRQRESAAGGDQNACLGLVGLHATTAATVLHLEEGGGNPLVAPLLAVAQAASALAAEDALRSSRARRRAGPTLSTLDALKEHLRRVGHARSVSLVGISGTLNTEGVDFRGASFDAVTLVGGQLDTARFDEARFARTKFDECSLEGASFRGATFDQVGLRGCKLGSSRWSGASLVRVDFRDANMRDVDFRDARLALDPNLEGARLVGVRFRAAQLRGAILAGQDLTGAHFEACNLTGAVMDGARLDDTVWTGATLGRASLRRVTGARVKAGRADLRGAEVTGTKLVELDAPTLCARQARFTSTDLTGCKLQDADFEDATLEKVVFTRGDLRAARVSRARLQACSFIDARLSFADFSAASATECLFVGAMLEGMKLDRMSEVKNQWSGT